MCLYGSQNQQGILCYTALADSFCITDVQSVYCAVCVESYTTEHVSSLRINSRPTDYISATLPRRPFIGLHYTIYSISITKPNLNIISGFAVTSLFCRNVWIYLQKNNRYVKCLIEGLFSKHVLQKLLFAEDENYLIICGSKVMDVLSIKNVVAFLVVVAPAVSTQL